MKRRKRTKSAKARLVQETIDKAQPGNNNELTQQDTTSKPPVGTVPNLPSASTNTWWTVPMSPSRKRELFDQLLDLLSLVDEAFTDPDRPYFPNEVGENF